MKKKPCLNCTDRHVGCHSKCEKYKENPKQYDSSKNDYIAYKKDIITREIKLGGRR